jgi:hypothetical protein
MESFTLFTVTGHNAKRIGARISTQCDVGWQTCQRGSRQGHSLVNHVFLACTSPRFDSQHHRKPSVAVHTCNFRAWDVEARRLVQGHLHLLNNFVISPRCLTLCFKSMCRRAWASAHTRLPLALALVMDSGLCVGRMYPPPGCSPDGEHRLESGRLEQLLEPGALLSQDWCLVLITTSTY